MLDTDRLTLALAGMTPGERKQLLSGMRALVRSADSLRVGAPVASASLSKPQKKER